LDRTPAGLGLGLACYWIARLLGEG
jgi:hypothetical protein